MCNEKQRKLCSESECKICYNRSFASHERSPNWSEKNELTPRQVFKNSNLKYWFKCQCRHEFEIILGNITSNNQFCPYCAHIKLCDNNNCQSCYEKSFASHERNKNWSEKNELTPRQIFKGSNSKYWFKCECQHEFEIRPNDITTRNRFCPYCGHIKLCDNNNCQTCYEKSFASSEKRKNWSEKNKLTPRQVFKSSTFKHWFKCECTHEFEITLNNITNCNKFCPYCAHQLLCDNNNCQSCYEKSFASSERSPNWNERKNKLTPRQVFKSSGSKYWFICKCRHEFEMGLNSITNGNSWCPKCVNKTEQFLHNCLLEYFQPSEIRIHTNFEWCKNDKTDKFLPFDFVIDHLKIIIELDGEQHFSQVSNWKSPEENLKRDKYKMDCANKNGYSIIRLLQEDVYKNDSNWQDQLIELLVKHNEPKNFFIGTKIEKYDKHIEPD